MHEKEEGNGDGGGNLICCSVEIKVRMIRLINMFKSIIYWSGSLIVINEHCYIKIKLFLLDKNCIF